ncbi:PTS sugar transporter subunit IIA [Fusobacterium perfoetens]|uniref:PTS sugar transporter subunit IIA n=1 Tax=Fusobacterium perfoetens TaxID=852 RepID=UPI001F355731|nr:PTS sugar transporter subunit IIA [Fusobacterium perfoetens]MCF2612183.1 PTS sugar transporter subunit IIA [Fusobacterium perfoetens]
MLKKILENKISIVDNVKDWQEAIKIAASPLVADGSIEERYIEAMIENIKKFGTYIVVAPKVAMPHSRPEDGVNKNCLALLKINEGVVFGEETNEEEKVYFIFILGAIDNGSHIETLMKLMDVIDDEEKIDAMTKVSSVKELMELI